MISIVLLILIHSTYTKRGQSFEFSWTGFKIYRICWRKYLNLWTVKYSFLSTSEIRFIWGGDFTKHYKIPVVHTIYRSLYKKRKIVLLTLISYLLTLFAWTTFFIVFQVLTLPAIVDLVAISYASLYVHTNRSKQLRRGFTLIWL